MRSLKFRAWDASEKEMLCHGAVINDPDGWFAYLCDGNDLEGDCLMQFTGLHDKNGKEIYEGDIIKCDIDNGIDEVVWKRRVSCFSTKKPPVDGVKDGLISLGILDMEKYTVVGNIYENPELL